MAEETHLSLAVGSQKNTEDKRGRWKKNAAAEFESPAERSHALTTLKGYAYVGTDHSDDGLMARSTVSWFPMACFLCCVYGSIPFKFFLFADNGMSV
jgi:hypothetical protein